MLWNRVEPIIGSPAGPPCQVRYLSRPADWRSHPHLVRTWCVV